MSINNSILKSLNTKDKNINFHEEFVGERLIKGKRSLIYKAYYFCPECGCVNENTIVRNETRISRIKIPKISELDSYLELKKQRYRYNIFNKRLTVKTNVVNYRCRISSNTKLSITKYSSKIITHKDIVRIHNVSNMTVMRVNNKVYDRKSYISIIYQNVCVLMNLLIKKRMMAFNMCDAKTGKTFDLVENRKLENLIKYFRYYTLKCRKS